MLVAISGTPGTGKTTVSKLLKKKGFSIVDLNELAVEKGFVTGIDVKRNSKIININGLNDYIEEYYNTSDIVFFDGHASHLLPIVDYIIILRCHPRKLKIRLKQKGWLQQKIKENVEAEALDVILCEAYELHSENNIFEIDTSNKSINSVLSSIIEIVESNFKPTKKYKIGKIDWSEEILEEL